MVTVGGVVSGLFPVPESRRLVDIKIISPNNRIVETNIPKDGFENGGAR